VASGFTGNEFWDTNYLAGMSLRTLAVAGNFIGGAFVMISIEYENIKRCARPLAAQYDLIPLLLLEVSIYFWFQTQIFQTHPVVAVVFNGFIFSKMS
jgi:hypothetical protein